MDWTQLYNLRASLPRDDYLQGILGPIEHGAFAREWTKENPWLAVPSLTFAIPAYTAAKATGLLSNRSPASVDEIFAGYGGMLRGLLETSSK
jgi:hypothetical protein